jgi:hypothetical protein
MLSPDQVASQGPGGFLSLNGGPTDPYYAQADGSSYASLAVACSVVPTPARRNRTVNVGGQEYWWLESDLSDNGLMLKLGAANPGTGGGGVGAVGLPIDFAFDAPQAGAQSYPLPAGATAIDKPIQVQSAISKVPRAIMREHCRFSAGNVVIDADAQVGINDRINLGYYTGSAQTGAMPVPSSPPSFELFLTPDAPGNNVDSLNWGVDPGSTLQLAYNPTVAQVASQLSVMNVLLGGTDPNTNQVGTLDYAAADNGHQCGVQDTASNKLYYIMQIINADGSLGPQQAMAFYPGNILLVG